jgi:hypothetical protein
MSIERVERAPHPNPLPAKSGEREPPLGESSSNV